MADLFERYARTYGVGVDEIDDAERQLLLRAEKEYLEAEARDVFLPLPRQGTALLVIDMTNDFVDPDGKMWMPQNYRIIPKLKKLIATCREMGIPVIYTEHVHHESGLDKGIFWDVPANRGIKDGALREGSAGSKVYDEISPAPGEKVVRKHRYSAFYNTDLEIVLRTLNTTHLIISGCATNYCCGATTRDAFFRDYKVIFGSDINITDNPDVHDAELMTLRRGYAIVLSFDEIMGELSKAS